MLEWSAAVGRAALGCELWAMESWQKGLDEMAVAVGLKEKASEVEEQETKLTKEEKIKKYEEHMKKTVDDPVLGKDPKHVAKMRSDFLQQSCTIMKRKWYVSIWNMMMPGVNNK